MNADDRCPVDTTPEAHAVQQAVLARMTPEQRVQADAELAEMVAAFHAARRGGDE